MTQGNEPAKQRTAEHRTDGEPGANAPADRDEASGDTQLEGRNEANRDQIRQAKADVDGGQVDTEAYGTPNNLPPSR